MYYIPAAQRTTYLKEISGLAKALHSNREIESIISAPDLTSVRNHLLDWVAIAMIRPSPTPRRG